MSYTIDPGSPKAVKAAAFGRALVRACHKRNVPLNELSRATGVGHTSLDNYRRGLILPKIEVARTLAAVLDAPELARMIEVARTFECARAGCPKTFRNDTGAPRKYCSDFCRRIAENVRIAQRRARSAGQTGDARTRTAVISNLRAGLRIADERLSLLSGAIEAMCAGCEPEGICRTASCPLRPFSPLPLAIHDVRDPRTEADIRSAAWTPARRERFRAQLVAAHAAGRMKVKGFTPEERAKGQQTIARRSKRSFSEAAKKAWATRRARRAEGIEVSA